MSIGKVEEARKVLIKYSKLAGKQINLSDVNLVSGESSSKIETISFKKRVSQPSFLRLEIASFPKE
jgi:hypothetical protein